VLGIDERSEAAGFLGLGYNMQREGSLAAWVGKSSHKRAHAYDDGRKVRAKRHGTFGDEA
jgi:hypothetical protein